MKPGHLRPDGNHDDGAEGSFHGNRTSFPASRRYCGTGADAQRSPLFQASDQHLLSASQASVSLHDPGSTGLLGDHIQQSHIRGASQHQGRACHRCVRRDSMIVPDVATVQRACVQPCRRPLPEPRAVRRSSGHIQFRCRLRDASLHWPPFWTKP